MSWNGIVQTLKKYAGPVLGSIPHIVATACLGPLGGMGVSLAEEAIRGIANLIFGEDKKEELKINQGTPIPHDKLDKVVKEIDNTLKTNPDIIHKVEEPLRILEAQLRVKLKELELKIEQQKVKQEEVKSATSKYLSDNEVEIVDIREETKHVQVAAAKAIKEDEAHVDNTIDARHIFGHNELVIRFGMQIVRIVLLLICVTTIASFWVEDTKMHFAREMTLFMFGSLCGTIISFFFGSPMNSAANRYIHKK